MAERITRMGSVWGWRCVLGFICPSLYGSAPDRGIYEVAPEGVEILAASMGINVVSPDNLEETLIHVDNAARQLADGGADFIHLAGPFGIYGGIDRDKQVKKRLEELTKLPVSMQCMDSVDALNTLSVKKIVHVHTGHSKGNYESLCRKLYEDNGFEMVNFKGLGLTTNAEARKLPVSAAYQLAREAYLETPQADGIYIDCGAWGGRQVVECVLTHTSEENLALSDYVDRLMWLSHCCNLAATGNPIRPEHAPTAWRDGKQISEEEYQEMLHRFDESRGHGLARLERQLASLLAEHDTEGTIG